MKSNAVKHPLDGARAKLNKEQAWELARELLSMDTKVNPLVNSDKAGWHFGRFELAHLLDAIYGPDKPEERVLLAGCKFTEFWSRPVMQQGRYGLLAATIRQGVPINWEQGWPTATFVGPAVLVHTMQEQLEPWEKQ